VKQVHVLLIGTVRKAAMASGQPGRVRVEMEVARVEGVLDSLGEMVDGALVLSLEVKSLQSAMDLGVVEEDGKTVRVNTETGEVVGA